MSASASSYIDDEKQDADIAPCRLYSSFPNSVNDDPNLCYDYRDWEVEMDRHIIQENYIRFKLINEFTAWPADYHASIMKPIVGNVTKMFSHHHVIIKANFYITSDDHCSVDNPLLNEMKSTLLAALMLKILSVFFGPPIEPP